MSLYLNTLMRGFTIVMLVSINVLQITSYRYGWAFCTGAAISWVWWRNAHCAAHRSAPYLQACYALGAGLGTITGMALVAWLKS